MTPMRAYQPEAAVHRLPGLLCWFYVHVRIIKYKLDAESRELHDLESRGPDVAS